MRFVFFDFFQTSGGLLAAIPSEKAEQVIDELRGHGYLAASVIGRVGRIVDFKKSVFSTDDESSLVWFK